MMKKRGCKLKSASSRLFSRVGLFVYFAVSPRTTLQENMAEQQERRKAEEKDLEAQRLLEEAAKEEVVEVLEAVVFLPGPTYGHFSFGHRWIPIMCIYIILSNM